MNKRTFPESVFEEIRKYYPDFNGRISKEEVINAVSGTTCERNLDLFVKYYSGSTLSSLSKEYGITNERIRQICLKCTRRVKRYIELTNAGNSLVLSLSVRSYNALQRYLWRHGEGELTPEKALDIYNSGKLREIRGIGSKTILEIAEKLRANGYEIDEALYSEI